VHLQSLKQNNQLDATVIRKILLLCRTDTAQHVSGILCPSSGARQTAVAASGFRMNVEVDVFSPDNTSTSTFIRKPEAATAV
jgi:hypothetical protein